MRRFSPLLLVCGAMLPVACASNQTEHPGKPANQPGPAAHAADESGDRPSPHADAFARSVSLCRERQFDAALVQLRVALGADAAACQRALLEPAFANGFRDQSSFRSAIHDAAVKHRISSLTLAPPDEPGEWIEIEGHVVDAAGSSVPGAVVRVFATDDAGRYHPDIPGETTPRLFGTLVADDDGRFTFRTIRPGPYPGTRQARHVHIAVRAGSLRLARPGYAVFDDDPLLAEPQNAEQRGEAIRIRMTRDGGMARGKMELPVAER